MMLNNLSLAGWCGAADAATFVADALEFSDEPQVNIARAQLIALWPCGTMRGSSRTMVNRG
jgi:hypothetical protein